MPRIDMNDIPDVIVEFLCDANCLGEYLHNINTLRSAVLPPISSSLIAQSFTWGSTQEGHEYWSLINQQWWFRWKELCKTYVIRGSNEFYKLE